MDWKFGRREFLQTTIAGGALAAGCTGPTAQIQTMGAASGTCTVAGLVSPGCRGTKVRVGKVYAGIPKAMWPTPKMDLTEEMKRYEADFARMKKELADVEFVGNTLVTSQGEARKLKDTLAGTDGILVIHLSMGIQGILKEILAFERPTVLFAAPYSGHEWSGFGALQKDKAGALLDCMLTADTSQLAVAIRPFRAIHHLREAKILNVTTAQVSPDTIKAYKEKFGTEIKLIGKEPVLAAYEAVPEKAAQEEADRWWKGADKIVEPTREEVFKSCRLALAFEQLLEQEKATVITVDCYGTMYHQLPAFPCIGNTRLNNMGLGGICESDLRSAMTHILLQGLVGRPGFISDPTLDVSTKSIILAHCLGTNRMDGPDGPAAPYKLRSIMERQEGAVAHVKMRTGQKVTQAELIGTDLLIYFTGIITDAPECERGCRTKITVKVDGDVDKLWQNWSHGLHRVTCYGDLTEDLRRFCRFKGISLVDEA